jgi:SAM-dependent methyltransferase
MKWLNLRVSLFKLSNVEIVKGGAEDPRLPAGRLSGILIVDAYHHFTNFPAMLAKMREALKPGGRLVIADYSLAEHRTRSRAEQVKGHEIDPELARSEVNRAGFEVIGLDDPFVKWVAGGRNWKEIHLDMWLMTAIYPK